MANQSHKNFSTNLKKMLAFSANMCYYIQAVERRKTNPGVAKFGIALEWGSRGRWFESSHSDQKILPKFGRIFYIKIRRRNLQKKFAGEITKNVVSPAPF